MVHIRISLAIFVALAAERHRAPALCAEIAMPRYFFDIKDGQDFPDLQGSEWPDLAAARLEAVRFSAEVLKEMPDRFWNCEEWTMSVSDSNRHPLFALKFFAENCSAHVPVA
jgi:hypothetical protein